METTYRFISDPGHGWLEVPYSQLVELGIEEHISKYSYVNDTEHNGRLAYLEEDLDAGTFITAMQKAGKGYAFREVHTNSDSRIRNYNPYPESYKFELWLYGPGGRPEWQKQVRK